MAKPGLPFVFGLTASMGTAESVRFSLVPGPKREGLPGGGDIRLWEKKGRRSVSLISPTAATGDLVDTAPFLASLAVEAASWVEKALELPDIYCELTGILPVQGEGPDGRGAYANPGILLHQSHEGSAFTALATFLQEAGGHLLERRGSRERFQIGWESVTNLKDPWKSVVFAPIGVRARMGLTNKDYEELRKLIWAMGERAELPVRPAMLSRAGLAQGIDWIDRERPVKHSFEALLTGYTLVEGWISADIVGTLSAHRRLELLALEMEAREVLGLPPAKE